MGRVTAGTGWIARHTAPFVLAILVSVLWIAPVAEAAQGSQGLQGGWAVDNDGNVSFAHAISTQFAWIQTAGAGWVRINFRLGDCFHDWTSVGCNGKTALQTYDVVIASARSNHLQVLGLLSNETWNGSPTDWTANNAEHTTGNGDNPYIQSFASEAAAILAAHFDGTSGPLISDWEIWNEPNAWSSNPAPGVYTGGSFIYPSNFAWLLSHSYRAIKAANPAAVVVSGGLYASVFSGHVDPTPVPAVGRAACAGAVPSGADYLCRTYAQGIAHAGWRAGAFPLDAVGQHLYVDQFGPASNDTITTYLQDLHAAYLAYEGARTNKKIDLTEVGWSTTDVVAQTQAQNLRAAFAIFQKVSYVERAYWFDVQDLPEASLFFGLVDANGQPKPAFAAYQQTATYE